MTVRDQRNRQHDPVLGIVPLKLSDILETSSQVTRWYPLDGGIGFGRIRLSLLFRSTETRLPPNLLGWDVGTFEFSSERIEATGYSRAAKLKLRTGGSVGKIPRSEAKKLEGEGYFWDLANSKVRLPVKYRYRSPVVFEFHVSGKQKADAYSVLWLHHLIDNETTSIDIPIWTTSAPARLTQNYITEKNCQNEVGLEDLKEVGRLKFEGRFKAGMDESHEAFIVDNDSRETYETWEACLAEGVRQRQVDKELPEAIAQLHEKSLVSGRDVLLNAGEEEKEKWLTKDGTDWSGAFGHDPKAYLDVSGRKRREPGSEPPLHDPHHPSDDEDNEDEDEFESSSSSDLGIQDADNVLCGNDMNGHAEGDGASSIGKNTERTDSNVSHNGSVNKQNKRTEERKHRGLMQWRPARNAKFAKDQGQIGLRKLKHRLTGSLEGRKPSVETGKYLAVILIEERNLEANNYNRNWQLILKPIFGSHQADVNTTMKFCN